MFILAKVAVYVLVLDIQNVSIQYMHILRTIQLFGGNKKTMARNTTGGVTQTISSYWILLWKGR
jgi:hypothetical protein